MLTGGSTLSDSTGSETIREQSGYWVPSGFRIDHDSDFLARFGEDRNAAQRVT